MLPWKLIISRKRIQLVHLSMKSLQSHVAALCVLMLAAPSTWAQQQLQSDDKKEDTTPRLDTERPHWFTPLIAKYQPKIIPPISVSNSPRIDSLIRAGNMYLSLQDAITLALENNIDIEVERYEYRLADTDLFRTKAGISARGIPTNTSGGASSVTAGPGYFIGNAAAGIGATAGGAGPLPITADPVFSGTIQWAHQTTPQSNTVIFGTTATVATAKTYNFAVSQGFATGTAYSFGYNNSVQSVNYATPVFNPATTSSFDLSVTQNLLQGFGPTINNRNIRIAKNNVKVADYVFQTQVQNTVSNIINLYWNLVSYIENVRVAQQSIASSQKLYDDNKKQVEIGTLAPIEVVRAQAEVASDQQVLVVAQTNVLQQETILKNALSRNGTANVSIADVHIIPTDRIQIPAVEPVQPTQDLYGRALDNRPDLAQARLQIDNANINLTGTRNAMLPTLNAIGDIRNNALAGLPNTVASPRTGLVAGGADPFFVGGYGTVLSQLFSRNFPNYSVGVQLNIPLRNRSAQADYATATLQLRMTQLGLQKQISQIRVDLENAVIALQQARAQYEAATQARILQEQSLDAEQKKFQLGSSTPYNVILAQRDLATARQNEVSALTAYGLARVQLDQVTGDTLDKNHIEITEARSGKVARQSNPVIPR